MYRGYGTFSYRLSTGPLLYTGENCFSSPSTVWRSEVSTSLLRLKVDCRPWKQQLRKQSHLKVHEVNTPEFSVIIT